MLLMWWSQAIIHFKHNSLETAAKKGKHLKHRIGKGYRQRDVPSSEASLESLRWFQPLPFYRGPVPWPWPASQEQMVARPAVKFDLNVEIQNSKSTFALLKFSPHHLPARITTGSMALRFRPLTFRDLCAKYNCIQVMFSCPNISLHIHCMLNLTSADSFTPVPYSLTCANAWMIHFPHVSSSELCLPQLPVQLQLQPLPYLHWPQISPVLTDDNCWSTGEILFVTSTQPVPQPSTRPNWLSDVENPGVFFSFSSRRPLPMA